jgi:catechol 2,3-dioxygenase-like lactoylglutathione lyase family enzyme
MELRKVVPIIVVDAIEPCLSFWTDRLGFALVVEVPHEDRIGFVILARDGLEVMYQTRASIAADAPNVAGTTQGHGVILYLDVDDINALERMVSGLEVMVPRRTTFYNSEEIFVRAPCGTVVGFAQPGAA